MRWIGLLLVALAATTGGCGGEDSGPLDLSWQLADGRQCPASSITTIEVRRGDALISSYACGAGFLPASVRLDLVVRPDSYTLIGYSAMNGELYRGAVDITLAPDATATLYATGSR